jgi:DNA-binding SARP family transcriptional activator/tetratricopeptide (TPR) repeat protein
MLAVIASAGERGVTRERLVALFWPDVDEERARHSARQALYGLRQELGREVIRSSGTSLSLDSSVISSDIGDFRAAMLAGNRAAALGLVRGPFLDAFYLPGATAFERWMEEERGRLVSVITAATLALATDATRANDRDAAVDWWRQLTLLDPLSGRYAVGFLKALAARGDRAEALAFVRQHELVIRRELEAEPDPDVRRFEAELRAMPSPSLGTPTVTGAGSPPNEGRDTTAPADPPAVGSRPARRTPRRTIAAFVAGLMLLLAVTAAFARQRGWFGSTDPGPTFAVGLIREDGVPDSMRSGRILTDMVATNLARVHGLRILANSRLLELMPAAVDSSARYADAARRAGASEMLEGHVLAAEPGRLTMELRRVDLRSGLVRAVYRTTALERHALVDSITRIVAGDLGLASPAGSIAEATTRSLVAYRFYEEGLRAYYQRDHASAKRLMRAALSEDSTFAMAAYYESVLTDAFELLPDGRRGFDLRTTSLRLAQRAPDRERLTITAHLLAENMDPRAIAVADSLDARYPGDPRALTTLSRVHLTSGDFARGVELLERAIRFDSVAERGDTLCRACDGLIQLADYYTWWDSQPAVQRTAHRLLAVWPDNPTAYFQLAISAARLGDRIAANAWQRKLEAVHGINPRLTLTVNLLLEDYDAVERDVGSLLASTAAVDRGTAFWMYFMALRNQGRIREAGVLTNTGWIAGVPRPNIPHDVSTVHKAIVALESGESRSAARLFGMAPVASGEFPAGMRARDLSWRIVRVAMALGAAGDTAALRRLADSAETWGRRSLYGRDVRGHHYIRGLIHSLAGRDEEAVGEFRAAMFAPSLGFTRVNYEMARSLLRLNRPAEAVAVLQPSVRGSMDASNLYISRTDLHELLAEAFARTGQSDSAAVHYQKVVSAWRRADPQFHARRDKAAAWIAQHTQGSRIAGR